MSYSTTVALGIRGDPGYTPPQWCFDQAEDVTNDIMDLADANSDGVLDEHEFSKHVAPLIYAEMRDQGFSAATASGTTALASGTWEVRMAGSPVVGPECDFNVLLREVQEEERKSGSC